MTRGGIADKDYALLKAFLSETAGDSNGASEELSRARAIASRICLRFERPVRVLLAGEAKSGKSTIANALAGDRIIPTRDLNEGAPPLFLRYGPTKVAFAGWWGEKERVKSETMNLKELAALVPDFILVQAPLPRLKEFNFFDIQGSGEQAAEGGPQAETATSADMVIWCTPGTEPWTMSEKRIWSKLPKSARAHALMAVTYADVEEVKRDLAGKLERLLPDASRYFQDVIPLDGVTAATAVAGGSVKDKKAWAESGAEQLSDALELAADAITHELATEARRAIEGPLAAFVAGVKVPASRANSSVPVEKIVADLVADPASMGDDEPVEKVAAAAPPPAPTPPPVAVAPVAETKPAPAAPTPPASASAPVTNGSAAPSTPAPVAPVKAPVPAAAPPKAAEPKATPKPVAKGPLKGKGKDLLDSWNTKIESLIGSVEAEGDFDSGIFLQSTCDIVMDLTNSIAEPGVLDGETDWLAPQFHDALDLLILLQLEAGDEAVEDASTVLLQLGRDVSWIASRLG